MPDKPTDAEQKAEQESELAITEIDKLDLEAAKESQSLVDMDVVKAQALKAFGHWVNKRGLPELLLTKSFQNLEQLERAHKYAEEMAASKKSSKKVRLQAIEAMSRLARTHSEMLKEILELSKQSSGKNAPTKNNVGAPDFASVNLTLINNTASTGQPVPTTDIQEVRKELGAVGPDL